LNNQDKKACIQFFENRVKKSSLLRWSALAKSTWHYKNRAARQGRKPSSHTRLNDGDIIQNESVVIAIRFILSEEFVSYGYDKVTDDLKDNGFIINSKKVYRLMKQYRLLCGAVIKTDSGKRRFVQWRVQQASSPMEQLCMDIKYVHIHGQKRNALLLTVLDVYSRSIVGQVLWWHIRKEHVIWLVNNILQSHQTESLTLRNDNGSQFIAHAVRHYLQEKEVVQEFIHVATPQENSFIEAYHSIIQRELLEPRQFTDIDEAMDIFKRWKTFYNSRRRHGSLHNQTPEKIWRNYEGEVMSKEQQTRICTAALSTNGERKSLKIEESRLVDKIFKEQMPIFESQSIQKCQTAF
jgi:transposase InsO family protein